MSAPTFTAVIPAFNAALTLASSIRSVLAQTATDFELIVVDDGSSDRTREVAASFGGDQRLRIVGHENRGLASARNTGIEHAQGRYVGFLDSDDLWMPTYLEVMGAALDADPGAGFAYTDGWALDDRSKRIRRTTTMARQHPPSSPPRAADEFLRLLVIRNFIPAEALVRRVALDEVGSFSAELPAVEDFELWLRMLAHGWRAVRPPGVLLVRRERSSSMSSDNLLMLRAHEAVWRMVIESHPAPDEVKRTAEERMSWARRRLDMLEGRHPVRLLAWRSRLLLGRAKRRLQGKRRWYEQTPPEVARAFPDLNSV